MKRLFSAILFIALAMQLHAQISVTRIDPTDWYVGMKNPSLQLMVYGKDIAKADVSVDYANARIDSVVRLESPNYLFVYLNLRGAKAGTMTLNFKDGKKTVKTKYTLKERDKAGEQRIGFSNKDVLYMLLPDRFADGNPKNNQLKGMKPYKCDRTQHSLRHGGDIEGIRQHLDYFTDLGVTAIWFAPMLENDTPDNGQWSTYHGYETTDYYRVDPRFGTNDDYKQLVAECHQRGLKVVMDMIFNHCSMSHPWLNDLPSQSWLNRPDYKNNYLQTSYKLTPIVDPYASQVDLDETVVGWFVPTMPDLNQKNPHVMNYLIQNSIWWIESIGIDGIRMDTYPYADREAMARWMKAIDLEYPNFNTVGETWVTEPAYTASWQRGSKNAKIDSYLKTVMDFALYDRLMRAKAEETDAWWEGYNRVYNSLCYDYLYPNPSSVMAFFENHDTNRFLENGCDTLALKQAYALLLTINRIPQLYYGTEVLMNGTKEKTDGDVRKDFPGGFPGDKHNAFTAEGRTAAENAMYNWVKRLLHWRQNNPLISEGKQTQFIPWKGVYVIARQYNGKTALTILNGTTQNATMEIKRYAEVIGNAQRATDIHTGKTIDLTHDLTLSPRQTLIVEF